MDKSLLLPKQSILVCDSGMTLLELLVAATLTMIVLGMTIGTTIQTQQLFARDSGRVRLNQNLRTSLDLLGIEIRQAGERLPANFPAIEVIDGEDGASDELIVRRHLIDEVLTICTNIAAGHSSNTIYLSSTNPDAAPACVYGGQAVSLAAYAEHRSTNGGTVQLYIYNPDTKLGEYIDHVGEVDSSSTMGLSISSKTFANNYTAQTAAIYILRESHYRISPNPGEADILHLVQNNDEENAENVMFSIRRFDIRVELTDGTFASEFDASALWSTIQSIEISLGGEETVRDAVIDNTVRSRFYPRNVLSL